MIEGYTDIATMMEIEEEIMENMLTKVIQRYGHEHTYTKTFAWYVEEMDLDNCEKVYKEIMGL